MKCIKRILRKLNKPVNKKIDWINKGQIFF